MHVRTSEIWTDCGFLIKKNNDNEYSHFPNKRPRFFSRTLTAHLMYGLILVVETLFKDQKIGNSSETNIKSSI